MRTMRNALLQLEAAFVAAAGVLALWGCNEGPASHPSSSPAAQEAPEAPRPSAAHAGAPEPAHTARAATPAEPELVLRSPGAAPRRMLRYRLVPGTQETLVMTMDMAIRTDVPGMAATPVEIPTVEMTMQIAVADKRSESEARYDFVLQDTAVTGKSGMMPEVVEATRVALEQTEGMGGRAIVDTRGFNRELELELPSGMLPQMKQMMDSAAQGLDRMSTPLPAEAVGKGARWELRQEIEQNGVALEQVSRFELIELDGNRGRLKITVTQRGDEQPMDVPGMPEGSAKLIELSSTGAGEIRFDLDRLVPISHLDLSSDYAVKLEAEPPQVIRTHLDMSVGIARR